MNVELTNILSMAITRSFMLKFVLYPAVLKISSPGEWYLLDAIPIVGSCSYQN